VVGEGDLPELLNLLRAYCDFYRVHPADEALMELARTLIDHPEEGLQLIARADGGEAVGFATVYWTWSTLNASRIGVMNDLFVKSKHRAQGIGRALIEECRRTARERGASGITWETQPDNHTAQRLYDKTGATRHEWIAYWLGAERG
jgi:ribosomal protein S18 acetylase RimI-like enzyme